MASSAGVSVGNQQRHHFSVPLSHLEYIVDLGTNPSFSKVEFHLSGIVTKPDLKFVPRQNLLNSFGGFLRELRLAFPTEFAY